MTHMMDKELYKAAIGKWGCRLQVVLAIYVPNS